MKKQLRLGVVFFLFITAGGTIAQTAVELNGKGNQTHTYQSNTGVTSTELEYRGKIIFNDAETDVTFISPGGFLKFSKKSFGNRRTIELEGEANGVITRTYREGNKKLPFEPDGRQWMASVLPEIIRTTGIGAEERVKKFYAKGGLSAVLNEINELSSDYVQSIYYSATLELDGLNDADIGKVLTHAGKELKSSYEQSKLLRNNSDKFKTSEANMAAAIRFVEEIGSSYEQSKVYIHLLTKEKISEANKALVIDGVRNISSAYEQSKVLVTLLDEDLSQPNVEMVITEIPNISSSYEQSKVLVYLIKKQDLSEINFDILLKAISSISSSYEQGKILRKLVEEKELTSEQIVSVAKASAYISSDYEQAKFIQSLVNSQKLEFQSIEAILGATGKINSSYERAKVLKLIASSPSFSLNNFKTFLNYAAQISSAYDQAKVLSLLTTMDGLSDQNQLDLIEAIGNISSNYERGKLLTSLSGNLSKSSTVRDAFLQEAKTLSDSDFGKIMRAIDY